MSNDIVGNETLMRSDEFENIERQDRLSIFLNATYVQWDTQPLVASIRLGRLIPESRIPLNMSKQVLKLGESKVLDYSAIIGNVNYEILLVNKTKDVSKDILDPSWVAIKTDPDSKPMRLLPDRITWLSPLGSPLIVQAYGSDALLSIFIFPE